MSDTLLSPEQIVKQLHWRYATKKFDAAKKISATDWEALEQSLVLAPSSFGLQPWKFFVIRNSQLREQLMEHSWGQKPVAEASHLIVFAIKRGINSADVERHVKRMAEVQQVPQENLAGFGNVVKGFLENPPYPLDVDKWAARQAYIALGFLLTSAANLGIDALPIEGFVPAKYDEILGLNSKGYSAVVLCVLGYRAADDKYANTPKVRFPTAEVVEYVD